jgi:hypothetical protein
MQEGVGKTEQNYSCGHSFHAPALMRFHVEVQIAIQRLVFTLKDHIPLQI